MLLPAAAVRGQDALISALALDRTMETNTNAPIGLAPEGHHLGPVPFSLGASTTALYDDNINGVGSNPQSDVLLSAGVNLGLSWAPTGESQLQLGSGLGYTKYLENTRNSGFDISPDSAVTYLFSVDDVVFTLFDQLTYQREVVSQAALANIAILPRLENTAGTRVAWNPGQWTLQASYSHDNYYSEENGQSLNRSSEYFYSRGGWRFAEATEAGLEASESLTSYQDASLGDNSSASVGAYVEWQLRRSLRLSLRGGPSFNSFSSGASTAGNSSLLSYYISFAATHHLTDYLSHQLSVNHSVQPGLNSGSAYIEEFSAAYSATWYLTQSISLGAGLTYENGSQPISTALPGQIAAESTEDFERYGVQPQILWNLTDKLSSRFAYGHWLRHSNLEDRSFSENSVSLNFTYGF